MIKVATFFYWVYFPGKITIQNPSLEYIPLAIPLFFGGGQTCQTEPAKTMLVSFKSLQRDKKTNAEMSAKERMSRELYIQDIYHGTNALQIK